MPKATDVDREPAAVESCYGLDPGTTRAGLSLVSGGEVRFVAVLEIDGPGNGWEMPALVTRTIQDLHPAHKFVVENQQVYGRGQADPNDLIRLSHVAGAAAGAAAFKAGEIYFPRPTKWKGGMPKGAHHAKLLAQLGWKYRFNGPKRPAQDVDIPETVKVIGRVDNETISEVLDSIALALWGLEQ